MKGCCDFVLFCFLKEVFVGVFFVFILFHFVWVCVQCVTVIFLVVVENPERLLVPRVILKPPQTIVFPSKKQEKP